MAKRVDITRGPFDPGGQPFLESENRVYLGIFSWNLAGGTSVTKAILLDPERRRDYWKWPAASQLIKEADRIGCEFEVPFGRWLGHDGLSRFNEEALDFLVASAGLAPITSKILVPSTSHIGYEFHPHHFAKWGATIDHMSQGRWGLNVVAGWIRDEVELFGETFLDHNLRYEICDEFVAFIKQCWSAESPFDFEGRFFKGKDVYVSPKPARNPRPLFINAGFSPAGTDFAAKNCEWLFTSSPAIEALGQITSRARVASDKYSRQLRIVTFAWALWAGTDQKAEEELEVAREMLDEQAASWFIYRALDQPGTKSGASFAPPMSGQEKPTLRQAIGEEAFTHIGLGLNGLHIVGGYDSVAESIRQLYIDYSQEGLLFSWLDPFEGLHQLEDEIMPRLKKMGLRDGTHIDIKPLPLPKEAEEPVVTGQATTKPEEDITQRGVLQDVMPTRRVEQRVAITRGPLDPGGQPDLETGNGLYLGLFGWNAAAGCSITKAVLRDRDRYRDYFTWPRASVLIKEADRVGLEFQLPLGRWRGFGGEIGFEEDQLDALTSASALAQVTSNILLASSVHLGSHLHPLHVARIGANIDHASGGRWGLNIVAGWNRGEAETFGLESLDHDLRYETGDEFVTLMKHSWSMTTPFEFQGQFFKSKHVNIVGPKPTRRPRPFLINAGYSPAGIDFAAKQCDWLLCRSPSGDWNEVKEVTERAKVRAAHNYGRRLKTLTYVYAVMAETDAQAQEEFEMLASMIDTEAADNFIRRVLDQPGEAEGALFPPETLAKDAATVREMIGEDSYRRMALGLGGMHLVGSYDTVAEKLRLLATECGQDGIVFSFFDPAKGLHELEDQVIPRLRKIGLRK